jgi:DNA primase
MDIVELLEENNVRIWTRGNNVSKGWIGLNCPFCDDATNHLGIKLSDYRCRCWKCGKKSLKAVLQNVLDIPSQEARDYIKNLDPANLNKLLKEEVDPTIQKMIDGEIAIKLPEEATSHFPYLHRQYLKKRNFDVLPTIRKYQLKAVNVHGPYKFRIIIPIIKNKRIVSFTSRDVTDKSKLRYKAAPKNLYPNPKHYVYNLDSLPHGSTSAILVEGPTDVWRLGAGSISFLGVSHHEKQIAEIIKKRIKKLHILFDNDEAGKRAGGLLSKAIGIYGIKINLVRLMDKEDPGSLSKEDALILMSELGIKPL